MKNPYEILSVKKSSTLDEIKSAYKQLVKQFHPDINNGSIESHEKMTAINAAYEYLQLQHIKSSGNQDTTRSKHDATKEKNANDTSSSYTNEHWEAFWAEHKAKAKAEYESMGNRMRDKVARNLEPIRVENLTFRDAFKKAKNYEQLYDICENFSSKLDDMINKMYDYVQKKHRYGMPPNYAFGEEAVKREEKNNLNLELLENIKFIEVNSSYIASVAYDASKRVLYVKFKDNSVFTYFNVIKDSYRDLMEAKSIGSHFAKNIRDHYDYKQLIV